MRALALSVPLLAALSGGGGSARAADVLLDCQTFRTRWIAAMSVAEPGRPPLAFERAARLRGADRVTNAPGLEALMACREGKLSHVEVREAAETPPSDPAAGGPLVAMAAAALVALEGDLPLADAERLVAAMRAETGRGRDAVSQWGPYEISLSRSQPGKRAELVIELPEN